VYVVPFPGPGGKYQISHNGGWLVRWDKKGDLFFLTTGNQVTKSGIKSRRAIAAGEISTSPLPDELGGHASTFVRRERGRAARASSDACSSRIQLDQPAVELAGTAAQVKYASEHLLLKAIYQRWICQQAGECGRWCGDCDSLSWNNF
jgi:hypothetical protein